ncbi:MAG: hypothetical protein EOL95_05840 [Bacteroidia bacterium]|nr:hypothetical protein [Bacteroidia bacterium]
MRWLFLIAFSAIFCLSVNAQEMSLDEYAQNTNKKKEDIRIFFNDKDFDAKTMASQESMRLKKSLMLTDEQSEKIYKYLQKEFQRFEDRKPKGGYSGGMGGPGMASPGGLSDNMGMPPSNGGRPSISGGDDPKSKQKTSETEIGRLKEKCAKQYKKIFTPEQYSKWEDIEKNK